jgi:hypothetical protein
LAELELAKCEIYKLREKALSEIKEHAKSYAREKIMTDHAKLILEKIKNKQKPKCI